MFVSLQYTIIATQNVKYLSSPGQNMKKILKIE